ncbi:CRISPR-associated protein Cmr1 [Bathymodiolus japonicus methanotrophic gill symbiont]|uniref:type III-B CRISPR module RAMP protein Cmr1 n=1 Tax=Bathymodiolus japonicus methanotrophic gill symbiont TaxID=113269 RepID=UPI001B68572A|nr:type III-B CRISPR module RAMP protein Cmr1 [Bathymodiolus japonicus methanotrophic gill symbiont]GFO73307.1 CRISPR-associated protein Cmr1 [Bathymodiolus japonicus methanotrophic gill symbiont]
MQKIEAEFEIVTPMFIGGAGKEDDPEVRPPSIKGALRFWWRALQWGAYLEQAKGNADQALQALHEQEAELFGAAFKDNKYGQGKVLLKLKKSSGKELPAKKASIPNPIPEQQYLLGQGLYHCRDGLLQSALESQKTFKVVLKLDNEVDAQPIINTLMLFGLLGGLGSRSRKGWGSVAIRFLTYTDKDKNNKNITMPDDKASYKKVITDLLSQLPEEMPPFTAFSKQTRIDLSAFTNKSAESLLTEVGNEQQMYRSYGRNTEGGHKVNGKDAEQNFKGDHDLVLDFAQGKHITEHPKRVVFGLPHNYCYSDRTKVDVDAEAESGKSSRRASPLMIHIHRFVSGECMAVQSLFRAEFLPDRKRIQLKKGHKTQMLECDVDWKVITNYLDRFNQRERIL